MPASQQAGCLQEALDMSFGPYYTASAMADATASGIPHAQADITQPVICSYSLLMFIST